MKFDSKRWKCPTCNCIGTLCTTIVDTTICRPVTSISHDYITTGNKLYLDGKFGGDICCNCETKIADTHEKLKEMFNQK